MVNKEKFFELLEDRKKANFNDPFIEEKYWIPMIKALGNDESEIIAFINSLDNKTASWVSEIYEEVVEKFPSDEMEKVFHRINNL